MLAVVPSFTVPWSFFSRSSSPEPTNAPAALSPKLLTEVEQVQQELSQQQESFDNISDCSSLQTEKKSFLKKVNKTRQPRRCSERLRQSASAISSSASSKASKSSSQLQQKKSQASGLLQHSPLKTRRQSTWLDRLCMAARWKMGLWQTTASSKQQQLYGDRRRSSELKSNAKFDRSGRPIDSEDSHDSMSSEDHHPMDVMEDVSRSRLYTRKRRASALDDQDDEDDVFLIDQKATLVRSGSLSQHTVSSSTSNRSLRPRQRAMGASNSALRRRRQLPRRSSAAGASKSLALDDSDSGNDAENDEFWNASAMSLKNRHNSFKRSLISRLQEEDEEEEEDRFILTPAAFNEVENDDAIVDVECLTTDEEEEVEEVDAKQISLDPVVEQLPTAGLVAAPGEIPTPMFHEVQLPWHKEASIANRRSLGRRCRSAEDFNLLNRQSSAIDQSNKRLKRRCCHSTSITPLSSATCSNPDAVEFEIIDDEVYGRRHRPLELIEKRTRSRELEMLRYEEHLNKLKKESPQLWL